MTMSDADRLARKRFAIINGARSLCVAIMLFGMGVIATGIFRPSEIIGTVIFAAGFIGSMVVPRVLARKWRTPRDTE